MKRTNGGKSGIVFTINSFHGNEGRDQWELFDQERGGLPILGESGIAFNITCQEIDFHLFPWLLEMKNKYRNLHWLNSTKNHVILEMLPADRQKYELSARISDSEICFHSEFYPPDPGLHSTRFHLVLPWESHEYSYYSPYYGDVLVSQLTDAPAVAYGNRIGIMMRERYGKPFIAAFQRFLRFPQELGKVLDVIEEIKNVAEDYAAIIPMDLEALVIGSKFGPKLLETFIAGIKARGLEEVFIRLDEYIDFFEANAIKIPNRVHRNLQKWTGLAVQFNHAANVRNLKVASYREKVLYGIAATSDIYAAWERKIRGKSNPVRLNAINANGELDEIVIGYSQEVIDAQLAAFETLTEGGKFRKNLESVCQKKYDKIDSNLLRRLTKYIDGL